MWLCLRLSTKMALVPTVNRLAGSRMLGHLCRLRPIVTRPSVYVLRYKAAQLSALHSCDASPLLPLRRTNLLDSLPMAPEISYSVRSYSKKVKKEKNKGGKSGKSSKPKVDLTDAELNEIISYDKMCQQMTQAVDRLQSDYVEQLSLRTSQGSLDQLSVETPDGKFPLIQLGQIVQVNPQMVRVNLASNPQYIVAIKTAISNSGMNLAPQQDGNTLFIPLPKVTREHREQLAKNAKMLHDKTKDKLRDIHNRFCRDLKKAKTTHSTDFVHNVEEHIDVSMKEFVAKSDSLLETKQKDLLGDK